MHSADIVARFGLLSLVAGSRRKGNINKNSLCYITDVPFYCCTKVRAVITGRLNGSGFDLTWFSSLFAERLCIFGLHGSKFFLILLY